MLTLAYLRDGDMKREPLGCGQPSVDVVKPGGQQMAKDVSLTTLEKRVAKALLARGWRNQDIQAWINTGRKATVNSGRITGVKKDQKLQPAKDDEVEFFLLHRQAYDAQTGLNRYDDERLIRAREAMILAVQVFNSAGLKFKTEVFTMLTNVAWTYLLHEFYERKGTKIVGEDGRSLLLGQMIERSDCPLSNDVRNNLRAMKTLRDEVEHLVLGKADTKWLSMFQACCLNFDKAICGLFGAKLTLASDLSFSLQFARPNLEQAVTVNKYEVSPHIAALDARLTAGMTEEQVNSLEFQFQVNYAMEAVSRARANVHFAKPENAEGLAVHNVVAKKVISDDDYPLKPGEVVKEVVKKTKRHFTSHTHQQAIRFFKIRPKRGALQPENTDRNCCIFNKVFKAYSYSPEWVEKLVAAVKDEATYVKIRAMKL